MRVPLRALPGAALLAVAACGSNPSPVGGGGPCQMPAAAKLSVTKVDPADGATGVFAGSNVSVTFNTCVDPASVTAPNFLLAGGVNLVAGSLSYDAPTATVAFNPNANLTD